MTDRYEGDLHCPVCHCPMVIEYLIATDEVRYRHGGGEAAMVVSLNDAILDASDVGTEFITWCVCLHQYEDALA